MKLTIQRKYGHKNAGHESYEWGVALKEKEANTDEEILSMAQAAFTEAMNESGSFALMKMLPTDKEYIPTTVFNPNAHETIVMPAVRGG